MKFMAIQNMPGYSIVLISLLLLMTGADAALAQGTDNPTDVRVIRNEAGPANGSQSIQLEEMWRAGGEDSEVIFGHIFRAEADASGNVYLLDSQLSEVPVFSPDGELIKTLSREGEGPGETREPVDLTMLPDGNLGIMQRFPGKVIKIDLEGTPQGQIEFGDPASGGFNAVYTGRCKGQNLIYVAQDIKQSDTSRTSTWYVSRFDAAGNELARCWSREFVMDFTNPIFREADVIEVAVFGSTPGPDGSVYIAPDRLKYAIQAFDSDGKLSHVIERKFAPRKRNTLEKGRVQGVFDVWAKENPGLKTEVEDVAATISGLYVDDNNHLWVENSRSSESGINGALLQYDVFDADGVFDRQVALLCEGEAINDQLFRVSDDMVVLVKGSIPAMYASMAGGGTDASEDDPATEMEVVCFRIP